MKRLVTVLVFVAGILSANGVLAQLETRSSSAGGVTVKVTPKVLTSDAPVWEFSIVLDTHTQSLSDDLLKTASIVDPSGARRYPTAWQGAEAGGHHREGVLRFDAIKPYPAAVELQIERAGERTSRAFRWDLK
jgi:hypothetical protein